MNSTTYAQQNETSNSKGPLVILFSKYIPRVDIPMPKTPEAHGLIFMG
jgi:hypothetical protein